MIRKELDPFTDTDKYAVAGRKAEEKMAFYLKRYFANSQNIYVLNHIRLELNDDAAQIDHLIIHPFGMTIVESKSVHGKIQIKDDGQWVRWYGNQSKGMASPLTQARLQAAFLKDILNRTVNPKDFFNSVPIEIMTAISDDGLILWPKTGKLAEVWKADQIADSIISIQEKDIANNTKELLSQNHIVKICEFLCSTHKPLVRKASIPSANVIRESSNPAQPKKPQPETIIQKSTNEDLHVCSACKSENLEVRFAHTYYFHCLDCEKNHPVKTICPICKLPSKLRKKKNEFFSDCKACNTSNIFFINL